VFENTYFTFFSDFKKNMTFYIFGNYASRSRKKSLAGSKYRVGTLGSVRFWQQWRGTINIKQPYIRVSPQKPSGFIINLRWVMTLTLLHSKMFDVGDIRLLTYGNHGLRGSASPVLTATGFVNERGQFSTPTESKPLDRSPKNLLLVIMSATPMAAPNLVQIRPRGASGQMGEI